MAANVGMATEKHYLRAPSDACPLETWQEIVAKAVDLAKAGDPQARAWLGKYLCGDADLRATVPRAELIAGDLDPLAILKKLDKRG